MDNEKVNILLVDDQPAKLASYEVILRDIDEDDLPRSEIYKLKKEGKEDEERVRMAPTGHASAFGNTMGDMAQPKDMRVLYTGDNEGPSIMMLSTLIANFNASGGWYQRHSEEDMRLELGLRGWYEGLHINGHYLVLDIDHVHLEPHPDHPDNQLAR